MISGFQRNPWRLPRQNVEASRLLIPSSDPNCGGDSFIVAPCPSFRPAALPNHTADEMFALVADVEKYP